MTRTLVRRMVLAGVVVACGIGFYLMRIDPNSVHANARRKICRVNLSQITTAKLAYADEHGITNDPVIRLEELRFPGGLRTGMPLCPDGGVYLPGRLNSRPTCSIVLHNPD